MTEQRQIGLTQVCNLQVISRYLTLALFVLCGHSFGNAKVLRTAGNPTGAFQAFEESGVEWKLNELVCVIQGSKRVACGRVAKVVQPELALVKVTALAKNASVHPGDEILRNVDTAPKAEAPKQASERVPAAKEQVTTVVQDDKRTSNFQLSVELGGAGLVYSVFGSLLFANSVGNLALNLGFSYLALTNTDVNPNTKLSLIEVPASLSFLLGGAKHFLELSGGADILIASGPTTGTSFNSAGRLILPEVGLGYRYWPPHGGLHFRATVYGVLSSAWFPYGGLSVGYAF